MIVAREVAGAGDDDTPIPDTKDAVLLEPYLILEACATFGVRPYPGSTWDQLEPGQRATLLAYCRLARTLRERREASLLGLGAGVKA